RHARKNRRGARCWPESLLRAGNERRNGSRRPVHSGTSAVLAATCLGAVAVHPEASASHQRAREFESYRATDGAPADRQGAAQYAPPTTTTHSFRGTDSPLVL